MTESSQSSRTDDSVESVIRKYSDTVFRIAYARTRNSYDAEDIMQEVFLRYIRRMPIFDSAEHEKAWFLRVTVNCAKSLLGSAWFRKTSPLEDRFGTEMNEKSEVYYAVASLPPDMRTIVHLYYYENCSVRETAEILSKSESSIKSALMRAREKLKTLLREDAERNDYFDV